MFLKHIATGNIGEFGNHQGEGWIELSELELSDRLLYKARESKLKELDNYHYNSKELRELSINNYYKISLSGDGRNLISEQIINLEKQIDLGLKTLANASFEYFYNGGSIEVSLTQLRQLLIAMFGIVNTNYQVYRDHATTIKGLTIVAGIEAYDFTVNYLKNQNITIN